MLLNIIKPFSHTPELGAVFYRQRHALLKDGGLDWKTAKLLILKAVYR